MFPSEDIQSAVCYARRRGAAPQYIMHSHATKNAFAVRKLMWPDDKKIAMNNALDGSRLRRIIQVQ